MVTEEDSNIISPVRIVNIKQVDKDKLQTYWQQLYVHDKLKYRLCNVKDPTWTDVLAMMTTMHPCMFMAMNEEGEIQGEFMLENPTGFAWQIHFSLHPELPYKDCLHVCRGVRKELLTWKGLETLYGLTPVTNRVACITVLKAGFKKVGILPRGMMTHEGVVDAMMTYSTRGE